MRTAALALLLAAPLAAESQWALRHQSALLGRDSASLRLGHEESLRFHGGATAGAWRAEWNVLGRVLTLSRDALLPESLALAGRSRALQGEYRAPSLLAGLEADQLSLRWQGEQAAAVLGRQSLNLGEAFFFSPLDLFAPFGPHEAYRDFRAGVDAFRGTWSPSAYSLLEAIAVDGRSLLLRAQANGELWSLTGLGGRHRDDSVAGAALQLEFGGSSWGLEGLWRGRLAPQAWLGDDDAFNCVFSHSLQWTAAISSRLEHWVDRRLQAYRSGLSLQAQASPLWTLAGAVFIDQDILSARTLQLSAERSLSDDSVLGLRFGVPLRSPSNLDEQWQPYRAELELRTTL